MHAGRARAQLAYQINTHFKTALPCDDNVILPQMSLLHMGLIRTYRPSETRSLHFFSSTSFPNKSINRIFKSNLFFFLFLHKPNLNGRKTILMSDCRVHSECTLVKAFKCSSMTKWVLIQMLAAEAFLTVCFIGKYSKPRLNLLHQDCLWLDRTFFESSNKKQKATSRFDLQHLASIMPQIFRSNVIWLDVSKESWIPFFSVIN